MIQSKLCILLLIMVIVSIILATDGIQCEKDEDCKEQNQYCLKYPNSFNKPSICSSYLDRFAICGQFNRCKVDLTCSGPSTVFKRCIPTEKETPSEKETLKEKETPKEKEIPKPNVYYGCFGSIVPFDKEKLKSSWGLA